uniref:Proteasome activator complex subunit 1 n=1 Tax=Sphaeramia orbicularis TaxID=375764 RepID=A0A673CPM7_9TELE
LIECSSVSPAVDLKGIICTKIKKYFLYIFVFFQTSFSCEDLASLKAPLDIPIPDPEKEEAKRKKKEEVGPPCGPIESNPALEVLLNQVDPEIRILKEMLNLVSSWLQLHIPQIQDGNNFGVAVQEKVFEMLTNTRTRVDAFQTQIAKYYSERGDAVAKASKQPHVGDYRQLVHELDQYQYSELRLVVLDLRNTYAALFDIVNKNYDKIKKPRGDGKAPIY